MRFVVVLCVASGLRRETCLRAHPKFKQKIDERFTLERAVEAGEAAAEANIPQTFDDILEEMVASVAAAVSGGGRRFVVECLPPGLNPELEATCPYNPSRELAVLSALLGSLSSAYAAVRVALPSSGDAAMATRAFEGSGLEARCSYCGLGGAAGAGKDAADVVRRVFGDAPAPPDAVFVVRPRNSVGDAVIEDVRTVAAAAGDDAVVFLVNPDLSEKVALGIRQKDDWAKFERSFDPAYVFRNLCNFERPSCRPMERGLFRFTAARRWETFHAIPLLDAVHGDLKRYGSYDVGSCRPMPFLLAATADARPSRDELAAQVAHGAKLAKVLREARAG